MGANITKDTEYVFKKVPVEAGVQLKKRNCVNNTASIQILYANQIEFFSEFHRAVLLVFKWLLMRWIRHVIDYTFRLDFDLVLEVSHTHTVQRRF